VGSASDMRCDRGVCDQHCNIGGRCNMNCSSSVTTGRCKQLCAFAKCDSMICNATNCTQDCFYGECKPPVTISSNATNLTTTSTTSKIVRGASVPLEIKSSVVGGLILALIEW